MSDVGATASALVAEDIHKSFGPLEVLKGISLAANDGDVVSIIGSSGSGKSTFLRCINFLEFPDKGARRGRWRGSALTERARPRAG